MKFFFLLLLVLFQTGNVLSASPAAEYLLRFADVDSNIAVSSPTFSVFEGTLATGKTFRNFLESPDQSAQSRLQHFSELFEKMIYPRFLNFLGAKEAPKITILFDLFPVQSIHRGMVRTEYLDQGKNIIVVDATLGSDWEFTLVTLHELQHLFNQRAKRLANTKEEVWLDEGLSKLMETLLTGAVPTPELSRYSMLAETKPLLDWSPTEASYAQSYLFVSYLYSHFGGDELIRRLILSKKTGIDNLIDAIHAIPANQAIDSRFLSFPSLYLNFSMALAVNGKQYNSASASHDMLSLTTQTWNPGLASFHMAARPILLKAFEKKSFVFSAYQSFYLELVPGTPCFALEQNPAVQGYLVHTQGINRWWISDASKTICPTEDAGEQEELILIHTGTDDASVTLYPAASQSNSLF